MFDWLAEFDQILVTGPQRSGTRICAQMIAQDTGFHYVDEVDFGVDSLYRLAALLAQPQRVVVQCPALCRYVHNLAHERMAVVLMRRDLEAIIASQQRIKWEHDQIELMRYDQAEGIVAQVKYDFWETHQAHHIPHAFEIRYESLQQHPLWVPQKLRSTFSAGQIDVHTTEDVYFYHSPDVMVASSEEHPTQIRLQKRGVVRQLNEVGTMVWYLCNGTRSQADIIQAVSARFEDTIPLTQLQADISLFINDLLAAGVLCVSLNRFDTALPT